MNQDIYFDNNATTKVDEKVLELKNLLINYKGGNTNE